MDNGKTDENQVRDLDMTCYMLQTPEIFEVAVQAPFDGARAICLYLREAL